MQNKGAVRLLIIVLVILTIYQLSFTFFALKARSDAKQYAEENGGDYKQEVVYLDSMQHKKIYNLLIKNYTLKECQDRQINLGLDLQGGMNVMLQVSVPNMIMELSNNSPDPLFVKSYNAALEEYKQGKGEFIDKFKEKYEEIAPNGKLATIFATSPQLRGQIDYSFDNTQVIDLLKEQSDAAISNAFNVLRTRIDRFGVTQPVIQQLEGQRGRILVELPGVKDEERVRNLLQQSASLDFYLTYDVSEIWSSIEQADRKVAAILARDANIKDTTTLLPVNDTTLLADTTASLLTDATTDSSKLLVDTSNVDLTREENLKNHPLVGRIYPSIDNNKQFIKGPIVGYVTAADTAAINKYLAMPEVKSLLPRDLILAWSVKPDPHFKNAVIYDIVALRTTTEGTSQLGGDVIVRASHNFDQNKGAASVSMTMNASAARKWAELTGQNIGKSIAIVLDGEVYSHPTVQGKITGGVSQISGNFTLEEAQDLANVLKSGKLPVRINIEELNHVGPSLGKESINAGLFSFIIAFLVVLIYMVLFYNRAGFVSDIALIANMFFIIGILASLGAVLTLPGIAGIVLTIGMSVDANVIIYDRIREELRANKNTKKAISDGYSNAYSAIIDANITTLLTGIILYVFGHGPIQGFATTLIIGIFTSLFSAIFITRIVFERMLAKNREIKFSAKWSENILINPKVNFLGRRKIAYIISGILILISIASLVFKGLDWGVDFIGGRTYIVRFAEDINTLDLSQRLTKELGTTPEVKTFGANNQVKITTKYEINSEDPKIEDKITEKMYNAFLPLLKNVDYDTFRTDNIVKSQKVGPSIASDIKVSAIYSIILALIVIFLYIFFRFRNWQFGLGATAALLHDSIIVLGIFSLTWGILPFSLEIDQAFIAAILTVVGYSVNDTVIIFDRIREFFNLHPKRKKFDTVNSALNSTLSRTINTSLTTFFVLFVIFMFGGTVIRGFVFALLIGVVVGTYSSLFIASPITFDTLKRTDTKVEKERKVIETKQKEELVQKAQVQETEEEKNLRLKKAQRKKNKRRKKK